MMTRPEVLRVRALSRATARCLLVVYDGMVRPEVPEYVEQYRLDMRQPVEVLGDQLILFARRLGLGVGTQDFDEARVERKLQLYRAWYADGNPGLSCYKFAEELGELMAIVGKLVPYPLVHPSRDIGGEIRRKVQEELADVMACIRFHREVFEGKPEPKEGEVPMDE